MLVIRFQRVGRRNDASFRIVVTEHTTGPKSNKHVEVLGSHNPKTKNTSIKEDRVQHWISMGAQVSDTVHNLLIAKGVIEGEKKNVLSKKSPIAKEEEEAPAAPAAEEAPAEETTQEAAPAEEVETSAEAEKESASAEEASAEEEEKKEGE